MTPANGNGVPERLKPYGPVIFQVLSRYVWFVCALWVLDTYEHSWTVDAHFALLATAWTALLTAPDKRLSSWMPVLIVAAITIFDIIYVHDFHSNYGIVQVGLAGILASLIGFPVPRRGKRSDVFPWLRNILLRCFRAILSLSSGVSALIILRSVEPHLKMGWIFEGGQRDVGLLGMTIFAAMVLTQFGFDHAGALVRFAMGPWRRA